MLKVLINIALCNLFNEKNGLNQLKIENSSIYGEKFKSYLAGRVRYSWLSCHPSSLYSTDGSYTPHTFVLQCQKPEKNHKNYQFLVKKKSTGVIFSFYFGKFQMVKKSSLKAKNLQSFEFTKGGLIAKRFFTSFQTSNMPNYYPEHYPTKKKDSNLAPFFEI